LKLQVADCSVTPVAASNELCPGRSLRVRCLESRSAALDGPQVELIRRVQRHHVAGLAAAVAGALLRRPWESIDMMTLALDGAQAMHRLRRVGRRAAPLLRSL